MLVEDLATLELVHQAVRDADRVALDIESNGYHHYFERTCILSLSTPTQDFVIDSLSLWDDMAPLRDLLCTGERRILLHGGSYDVLSLKRDFDYTFPNVADSLLSAQLLGFEVLGLAGLVKMRTGIELPKELQRHDWTERPLKTAQLSYLANDTRFLFEIIEHLEGLIATHDLKDEYELECRALAETEYVEKVFSPEDAVDKLKDARRIPPHIRGLLRALFAWRDEVARELDLAPFRVIANNVIMNLANNPPDGIGDLENRRGVGRHIFDTGVERLLKAIDEGLQEAFHYTRPRSDRPAQRRDYEELRTLTKAIKTWRNEEAEARGIGIQGVLPTTSLKIIVETLPTEIDELVGVDRLGERRIERYGEKLLKLVTRYCPQSLSEKASSR